MEANVEIVDRRLKRLTEVIEASKDRKTIVMGVEELKLYQECLHRLAMIERHVHNLNVQAYKTLKLVNKT